MEELRLAQCILEAALSVSAIYELDEICVLEITKGEYSTIDEEKFLHIFEAISQDTPLSGCLICINPTKAKYYCSDCTEYHMQESSRLCPFCGSDRIKLLGGYGFYLDRILC